MRRLPNAVRDVRVALGVVVGMLLAGFLIPLASPEPDARTGLAAGGRGPTSAASGGVDVAGSGGTGSSDGGGAAGGTGGGSGGGAEEHHVGRHDAAAGSVTAAGDDRLPEQLAALDDRSSPVAADDAFVAAVTYGADIEDVNEVRGVAPHASEANSCVRDWRASRPVPRPA